MTHSPIANAADYADALIVARRAKNWLFVLLLLMVLAQLTLFFLGRYQYEKVFGVKPGETPAAAPVAAPAAAPTSAPAPAPVPVVQPAAPSDLSQLPQAAALKQYFLLYVVGVTDFLGIVVAVVLMLTLLLIVNVMLVGQAIGVSQLTSAFVWSIVLAALLFPWQAFLNVNGLADVSWKIPGILYNFDELKRSVLFDKTFSLPVYLKWGRFVVAPLIGIFLLLMVQAKSSRGLRMALGEAEMELPEQPTGA